ncbi:MAG: histidinol-phosphate aminotransferase [Thermoplasmata archaeon]|jgi:histidinol-phosphate aminotransferase|nr:histidinol-phosphate aminotransferase [Thermoplasmata archaeon]
MSRVERIDSWVRAPVRSLKPYYKAPEMEGALRLDQNTNLMGPNPALAALRAGAAESQYPSRDSDGLLAALAEFHGHSPDNFLVANGGDEALDILVKSFGEAGAVLATPIPSYSLYPFYPKLAQMKLVEVPLRAGFAELDVPAILAAKPRIVIVASPNNPTGNRFPADQVQRLVDEVDGIVVVDEAYIEYAGLKHSLLPRVEAHDNLVVLRTFSKAYGLAGLRVGVLAANRELMGRMRLVKPPFNLGTFAERAAVAALDQQEWVDAGVKTVRSERERLATRLRKLGFRVHPTDANFLLTDPPLDAGELLLALRKRGILARTFPNSPAVRHCIRFTVGRPEHTDALVAALTAILGVA